ncbi:MAG: peptidase C15 [Candidatus Izemoplasmataceae bacterium]
MKKIILTAFEPFGNDIENPTMTLLDALPDNLFGYNLVKVILPVVYEEAFNTLKPYILKHDPVLILMFGLAAGRSHVNLERIAINVNDSASPDNNGLTLKEQIIKKDGPDGIFANFPFERIALKAINQGVPIAISNSAGTYVCNDLMYRTLDYLKEINAKTLCDFVHVPYLTHQVTNKLAMPSMSLTTLIDAVMLILDDLLNPHSIR